MSWVPRVTAFVLVTACTATSQLHGAAVPLVCEPSDARAANMLSMVRRVVTATDPDPVAERDALGFVAAPAASVQLEIDEGVCAKAKTAFNAKQRADGLPEVASVYVVRAGQGRGRRYVVKGAGLVPDPRSEFGTSLVFDRRWRLKSAYGA